MVDQNIKNEVERIVRTRKEAAEATDRSTQIKLRHELNCCYESLFEVCLNLVDRERKQKYIDDTTGKNTGGW